MQSASTQNHVPLRQPSLFPQSQGLSQRPRHQNGIIDSRYITAQIVVKRKLRVKNLKMFRAREKIKTIEHQEALMRETLR